MYLPPAATNRSDIQYAWRGPSLLVVEPDGWCGTHKLTGFFFRQCRFLRQLRFLIDGEAPYPCSIAESAPHELELAYIHPEVEKGGGGGSGSGGLGERDGLLFRNLDVRLTYVVHPAALDVTLAITNRWQDRVELSLSWLLSADYATVDEAQFDRREQNAPVIASALPNGVAFRYTHAELPFETRIVATGGAWTFDDDALSAHIVLPRQETTVFTLHVSAVDVKDPIDTDGSQEREAKLTAWQERVMELHAPAETPLVEIANRAAYDLGSLALLEGPSEEWLTPGAGVPLYLAVWARDALTASWQAGLLDRGDMIADVLTTFARLQGTVVDPARDEEPGRIVNQAKTDPISRLGKSGFDRNYADVASPFMYIIALGYHYVLTGDKDHVARRYESALRVLEWADQYGDRDGDGYIEYLTHAPHGPKHQGWKDSENAIVYDDGRQVDPPIAPCEIQGYWHIALQFMAALSVVMGYSARAAALWRQAAELKARFNRDFWLEDEGYIAFGLDAEKRQIRALTSNAGQCIPTGIVSAEHLPRLVRRMFEPDLFSGWGIRTLSSRNPAYNPLDYHLGNVWPVENGSILFGLRRYGFNDRALQLTRALYDLARLWPQGRIPECVGGYSRDECAHPGTYPRANRPQTWNQSIWPIVTQVLTGIVPFAPLQLLLVDPILPSWVPELTVKRLRVGDATVTLRFWRDADGASHYEVVEQEGTLRVLRQAWVESFSADIWQRMGNVMQSVFS